MDNNADASPEKTDSGDRPPTPSSDGTTAPAATNEIDVGTSYGEGGSDAGKKRGRGDANPATESKVAKKKGELTDTPKGDPKCATCNKIFKSWKALFGHLRSHPERTYRGALPPPTAAELDMKQRDDAVASSLLSAAQVAASTLSAETRASSGRGLDIDLNQPTPEDGTAAWNGGLDIDLNAVPAAESDEEHDTEFQK